MSRVAEVTPENASPEQRRIIETIASTPRGGLRGPFKVMLHSPKLADAVQNLGTFIRYGTALGPRVTSLVALVTGRHLGAAVEWVGNSDLARKSGIDAEAIQALLERRRPAFAYARDEAVYEVVTELHQNHQVSDATFDKAVKEFGVPGTCELVGVAGYYMLVGLFLKAFRIQPPDDAPKPFPD
jgi:4-carboxymuconolactone decarboxylase